MTDGNPPQNANELLRRYQNGERYFGECELDNAVYDLRGVTLSGADFTGSYLFADFRDADLRGINFTNANVKTCDFRGANLAGAVFCGALLESTQFVGAVLTGADFEGASIYNHFLQAGEKPDW